MWHTVADVLSSRFTVVEADLGYWHWAFLAQPAPLPERLITADPDAFFDFHVRALGLGRAPGRYPAELIAGYRALLDDASTVTAICEDYRAGSSVGLPSPPAGGVPLTGHGRDRQPCLQPMT
jgi:hypothetical protein